MTETRISRAVPLDQLRGPETDVRERRDEQAVKSLAGSMGDPDVGQLQDVLVHPVDYDEVEDDAGPDELDELFRDGHPLRIVDGETRRLAAQRLGWATLDATIVPRPPQNTVVAQLDANTERIDMSGFETVRALHKHYQETDATHADIAEQVGWSRSHVSKVFGLFDCPEFIVDAWRHPDHNLETGHALDVARLLSSNTIDAYAHAGDIDEDEARDQALEDARLMVDVQQQHDLQVGDFRARVKRKMKETKDQLRSSSSLEQQQADGQRQRAESEHTDHHTPEVDPCLICGGDRPHRRKFAVPVCSEDYGMLSEAEAAGEPLMAQADPDGTPPDKPPESAREPGQAARALADQTGIPLDEAAELVDEVDRAADQRPPGGGDD